jgi:hypothetical protein
VFSNNPFTAISPRRPIWERETSTARIVRERHGYRLWTKGA